MHVRFVSVLRNILMRKIYNSKLNRCKHDRSLSDILKRRLFGIEMCKLIGSEFRSGLIVLVGTWANSLTGGLGSCFLLLSQQYLPTVSLYWLRTKSLDCTKHGNCSVAAFSTIEAMPNRCRVPTCKLGWYFITLLRTLFNNLGRRSLIVVLQFNW